MASQLLFVLSAALRISRGHEPARRILDSARTASAARLTREQTSQHPEPSLSELNFNIINGMVRLL
jgi:hypothetical protein